MTSMYVVTSRPGRFANPNAVMVKKACSTAKQAVKQAGPNDNVYMVFTLGWSPRQVIDLSCTRHELVLEADMSV